MSDKAVELKASQVRKKANLRALHCTTTDDLEALADFVGQERAVRSINFGLEVSSAGYNIFVVGLSGSGRTSYTLKSVSEKASSMPAPDDWIYVNNFDNPSAPEAIALPAGTARTCAADCAKMMDNIKHAISRAYENSSYDDAKSKEISSFQESVADMIAGLSEKASEAGFLLKKTPQGFINIPVKTDENGESVEMPDEEFEALSDEEKKRFKQISDEIAQGTLEALRKIRASELELKNTLDKISEEICTEAIKPFVEEFRNKYGSVEKFKSWLETMERQIIADRELFLAPEHDDEPEDFLQQYRINAFVCNSPEKGAPVVWETNPSYHGIAGKMEYESRQTCYTTDFTKIVPGALHRANGGYLIMDAQELLRNYMAYDQLKRVLRSHKLAVENLTDMLGALPVETPRPEAIPISTKVILIGDYDTYYLLQEYDPEFPKFFKTVAEFDVEMPRTPQNEQLLARFIKTVVVREHCLPFSKKAIGEIIEAASRCADDQSRLSTRFNRLQEYIIEASAWARSSGASLVEPKHVLKAIEEKRYRSGLTEEKIYESFEEQITRIDASGSVVGQANGLVVVTFADVTFGHPVRLTANTYMGQEGVVNIERETSLAGPIHNKGLLTLASCIGRLYAQDIPLTLTARISFEQNYSGIDGDSASSAELYCLLSSLAEIPLKQNIAVTGSVDQFGNIQPIGGVNEKIEGFFETCQRCGGLDGTQGVLIPWQNCRHLMLSHDVVRAVKNGRFHIWTCENIDQGIELLTGVEAGVRGEDGAYPAESVHGRAMAKLQKWAEKSAMMQQGECPNEAAPEGGASEEQVSR